MVSFNLGNVEKVTLCTVCDDTQESHEYLASKEARLGAASILCLREALEVCRRQEAHGLCLRNSPGGCRLDSS